MRNRRFTRIFAVLMCLITTVLLSVTASADMGPKPSVNVNFENLGDELCYATLLSRTSTGPASAWNGNESDARHNGNEYYSYVPYGYDVWKAFVDYEDSDGFYFLQEAWQINETKKLAWTYYPPNEFKILLYFPETNTFASSGIYERYAFDTYFTVNMEGVDLSVDYNEQLSTNERLEAYKSYNYRVEIMSLAARIVITILIEMALALIFGYREKKQLLLLAGVNSATQIILNVLLNIINYNSGELAFVVFYVLFELIVFAVEAVVYYILLNKLSVKQKPKWLAVIYALVANAASFVGGMVIAQWLPGIF
ncbi:MAG: hypothetical protein ACI4QY_07095 [Oscillospiraceae bacterium]